ncbi:terminase small subunit [Mesorhizobium captivum]|uniref:terminase small subunit n=1 Tax=Mesorhizobium captivum TaxID=3072319 RepID=UPI002A243EAD|nr:terminase small subunit [Mesorhizobium sp. VK23E]MDX8513543.1 terminase small subunit [Mesorhizobium sp. VK23E]
MSENDELTKRFPLPEGVPDAILNKGEVAQFFGVSLPTVDAWLRDGMPWVSEGTNGRAWEFRASEVWAWRQSIIAHEETRSAEAQAAIEAMRLKLIGGQAGDTLRALPPRERQQIYDVELAHRRLMAESNRLIEREVVLEHLQDLLSLMRDTVTGLSDRLDREASLNSKQVEAVDRIGADLLEKLGNRIVEFFNVRPVIERPVADRDLFNQ